jgi:hypothetical protein
MRDRLDTQVNDYDEICRRIGHGETHTIAAMILAASIDRASERIAGSIDNLELVIRTKKPEGL